MSKKIYFKDGTENVVGAIFEKYGVIYENGPVIIDGVVITANGPFAAHDFGKKIVEVGTLGGSTSK